MQQSIFAKYESVVARISSHLIDSGFAKGKTDEFLRKREKVFQRLAISLRELPGGANAFVEISPGFNFPEIEKMAAALQGKSPRAGFITCSLNIGLLTEKAAHLEWSLYGNESLESTTVSMIKTLDNYANPFWQHFLSVEDLLAGFETGDRRLCRGSEWPWRQLAAYCLTGRTARAVELLQQRLAAASPSAKPGLEQDLQRIGQLTT